MPRVVQIVGDVRGVGGIRLVEFVTDRKTLTPAPEATLEIIQRAIAGGPLLIRAGLFSNGLCLLLLVHQ